MVKYKFISKANIRVRSLRQRFSPDETLILEDPAQNVINELERCDKIGLGEFIELKEVKINTYDKDKKKAKESKEEIEEEVDKPKEEIPEEIKEEVDEKESKLDSLYKKNMVEINEVSDDETEETDSNMFYCKIHDRNHYKDSKVGQKCLKELENLK